MFINFNINILLLNFDRNMQNTRGGANFIRQNDHKIVEDKKRINKLNGEYIDDKGKSYIETAIYLFNTFGFRVFFDGIQPKLYRAAVNHSVTFYIYDLIMKNNI